MKIAVAREPRLDVGLADLEPAFDLLLCDVWGVIHNGVRHHPEAVDALVRFRGAGGTVVLITNAPVPKAQVVRRLDVLAVPSDAYDDVATSGDVTIARIVAAGCPPLHHIGPPDDIAIYREAERLGGRAPKLVGVDAAEICICVGLDDDRTTPEAYDTTLEALHSRDLELVCANPDIVVEVGDDLVYCAGAIARRYGAMGGAVVQAGKPFAPIYERAIAMGAAIRGQTPAASILAIGDAMATDMQGAHAQGLAGLFVTGGIHRDVLHAGKRGSAIERTILSEFLRDFEARPLAALPALAWRAA